MIIEIALGMILAVVILAFAPILVGLGIVAFSLIALLVVGVLLFTWLSSDPASLQMLILISIGLVVCVVVFRYYTAFQSARTLRIQIQRRHELGYDTTDMEQALALMQTPRQRLKSQRSRRKDE